MYHFYDLDSKAHFTVRFLVILHVVSLATVTQCKPTACSCKDIVVMIALSFQMCPLKIENGTLGNMLLFRSILAHLWISNTVRDLNQSI